MRVVLLGIARIFVLFVLRHEVCILLLLRYSLQLRE